jgi:hypothetical protein
VNRVGLVPPFAALAAASVRYWKFPKSHPEKSSLGAGLDSGVAFLAESA